MEMKFEENKIVYGFEAELKAYGEAIKTSFKTGFAPIDEKSPLTPGMYLLGAIPSMGKTTMALNIAANISDCGTPVLYINYEQSKLVLACKDFARFYFLQNYTENGRDAEYSPQMRDILRQKIAEEDRKQYAEYLKMWQDARQNFYFWRGTKEPASAMCKIIEAHIQKCGVKFVVIDYIQRVPPEAKEKEKNLPLKERIDSAVEKFKELQERTGTTLLIISSFNRENYKNTVDFEAFKETGGLEYAADGLFGLQFKIDTQNKEKRDSDTYDLKRQEYPRNLEFVCSKNRYGETYKFDIEYFTRHDLFAEVGDYKIPAECRVGKRHFKEGKDIPEY